MKLTKSQLQQIIREELQEIQETPPSGPTVPVELTQKEANAILLALEDHMVPYQDEGATEDPNYLVISDLYDKIFDSGIAGGFGRPK